LPVAEEIIKKLEQEGVIDMNKEIEMAEILRE
jgi:hypothetical protein